MIAVLVVLCQTTFSQSTLASDSLLRQHSNALQFQIADKSILQPFMGTTISFKHHVDRFTAYRFGVSMSLNTSSNDGTSSAFSGGSESSSNNNSGTLTMISIQVSGQKLWYTDTPTGVFLFCGAGPFIGFSLTSNNYDTRFRSGGTTVLTGTTEQTVTGLTAGASALVGVEWFASTAISLHAEYGISAQYSWTKTSTTSNSSTPGTYSKDEGHFGNWQLAGNGVRFGLSVYF
jgi:hypothetical protein